MALWSLADLDGPPPVFVLHSGLAVFSGYDLTDIDLEGDEVRINNIHGPPTKGSAFNGIDSIRFDSDGEAITARVGAISGGTLFAVCVQKLLSTGGISGIINKSWAAPTNAVVIYADTRGDGHDDLAFGNGFVAIQTGADGSGPFFHTSTPSITDTDLHLRVVQLGETNGLWVDGVNVPLAVEVKDAFPSYGASDNWEIGRGAIGSESLKGDLFLIVLLQYAPSADERQKLEGWASWEIAGDGSLLLDEDHPYKNAPPTTGAAAIVAQAAMAEASDGLSFAAATLLKAVFAESEAGDVVVATGGASSISAALAAVEAGDVVVAVAGSRPIASAVDLDEASDSMVAVADLAIEAWLWATEASDAVAAVATLGPALPIHAAFAVSDGNDSLAAFISSLAEWVPVPLGYRFDQIRN